ncbi:MAG: MltA domain-containing protein, partial [Acidobacteriota bacterium]
MAEPRRRRCHASALVGLAGLLAALSLGCSRQPAALPETPAAVPEEARETTAETALVPVRFERLPLLLDDGDSASLRQAVERSRRWLARRPADQLFTFGPRQVTARQQVEALDRVLAWLAEGLTPEQLAVRMVQAFDVLESVGNEGEMLITGYYVPVIEGSRRRRPGYDVPVYGPPGNLIRVDLGLFSDRWKGMRTAGRLVGNRLLPYPDRREIRRSGTLRGREIAWARDRVDLFFIEIQGSGVLRLPDGGEMRIGYAGSNGREYRSI